ncbi:MAG: DNA recombination protein RmuC [Acidobacteria bacterium]|nr:DNA recombination protein RmuC [Acidobacteriota bacterium]
MDALVAVSIFAVGLLLGFALAWLLTRQSKAESGLEQSRLREAFEALAAQALRGNTQSFLDLAKGELEQKRQAVDALVKPLQDSLAQFGQQIQSIERQRADAYGGLRQQVTSLVEAHHALSKQTTTLAQALKAPQVRGRWGEIQLRRVVELAGMLAYCDFEEQAQAGDSRLRPDLIVKLPNQRLIVVDAKAPLNAYLEAIEATDEATRNARLADHAARVRAHIRALGGKDYGGRIRDAAEFVVCFMPGEVFLSAALEQDPSLLEFGVDQGVLLATPTTLISLLKAVAYGWNSEKVAESARQIQDLGKEVHERLGIFAGHIEKLGSNLATAVKSYNAAVGSLESRVLPSARKFEELGAASAKPLPELERVEVEPRDARQPGLF